jgi:hypothetical protein
VTNFGVGCVYKVTFVVIESMERTSRPKLCMK